MLNRVSVTIHSSLIRNTLVIEQWAEVIRDYMKNNC